MKTTAESADALRALLDSYLRCPVRPVLAELEQALAAYQTDWIRERAGADAPPAAEAAPAVPPKPRFKLTDADRTALERMAAGWFPTTAELPRWAWFEDRELVRAEPNPAGSGPDVLRITPEGLRSIGRRPA